MKNQPRGGTFEPRINQLWRSEGAYHKVISLAMILFMVSSISFTKAAMSHPQTESNQIGDAWSNSITIRQAGINQAGENCDAVVQATEECPDLGPIHATLQP